MLLLIAGSQDSIMPDADKALRRHMHQEPADKLRPGNRKRFPALSIFIVLNRKGDRVFIHTDDSMVADSDSVCVFPEVADDRLRPVERFLAVGNPFLFIAGVQQFLKGIMVPVFFKCSAKHKAAVLPELF